MRISRRVAKLEQLELRTRPSRIVIRWEGAGGEDLTQPSQEEPDDATEVIVVRFVE
jgi:hypothetical protein